ncbi:50S ribosomal protein L2 [Candidatus Falkowbacteria bacterium]|nr:50S ribosomal protein L2 [Candidatus Falkowbacteria bacterium]
MAIKLYKPTTPTRRHSSVDDYKDATSKRSLKHRVMIRKKHGGRNSAGKISVRHQGGGAKQYYRQIDFKQNKFDIPGTITGIEYDPNRTVRIAVVTYTDGDKRYMLLPENLPVGAAVVSSRSAIKPELGNRMPLQYIPAGMVVHNIELSSGRGGALVRSAGAGAQLMGVEGEYAQLKLPSTEVRLVPKNCAASIGQLSSVQHQHIRLGKAGRKRHMGIRPSVRGKAMNPVDHPHGGGEGLSPIGLKHPKTPWGKIAIGGKTRQQRLSNRLIITRRKNNNLNS